MIFLSLKHCNFLTCFKTDLLKISHARFNSRSAFKPRNSVAFKKYSFYNQRNYSNVLIKSFVNNNLTPFSHTSCFQKHQSRNFTFESVLQTQAAVFKYLSECTVVEYTQNFVILTHDTTGLPWWATIILTTCIFRVLVTFPLAIYQNYVIAKLANLSSEMAEILKELKLETAIAIRKFHWSDHQAKFAFSRSAKKQWTKLIERDNCHPVKASLLIWFQIPMWVVISTSLRNIVYMLPYSDAAAQIRVLELSVGGCLWFPNLTEADSMALPISLGLINLAIIEIQSLMRVKEKSRMQRYLTNFFRGISIVMIPIAATVPSCLTLYWTTSSVFGLCQNLILMSPRVKQLVGIPKTKNDIQKPYTHLMTQIKNKFRLS